MRKHIALCLSVGALLGFAAPAFAVDQPHMDETLRHLEQARHEIDIADAAKDHGGHAGEATKLIDEAIREVKEGIRWRNEHNK
jgi:hypothetical protein